MRSLRPQPGITPDAPQAPSPRFVCPYCGGITHLAARCEHCRGPLDPLSRQATQNTMGPWFIRDEANPFRPGCSLETMRSLIERGRVGPDSIVRGPTTRQFWCAARRARGIAHLLGYCPDCAADVNPTDTHCDECSSEFAVDSDRQSLGLGPVVVLFGQAAADAPPAQVSTDPFARQPGEAHSESVHHSHDLDRIKLASARETARWLTSLVVVLLLFVLVLGYVAFRAESRTASPSKPAISSSPDEPPREVPPATATPSAQPAAPTQESHPDARTKSDSQPIAPRPKFDAELERAKRLLSEGTHDSVSKALSLAEAATQNSPDWRTIKQLAQRRLVQLKLRSLR